MDYTLLILLDSRNPHRRGLMDFLKKRYGVVECVSQEEALKRLRERDADIVLSDTVIVPEVEAGKFVRSVKRVKPQAELIFFSPTVSAERAVEVMKAGAYDFLKEPMEPKLLNQVIRKAIEKEQLFVKNLVYESRMEGERPGSGEIIGRSKKMKDVLDVVARVSPKKVSVLIWGESGTGKELIARAIHRKSDRRDGPFIRLNCAVLSEGVLESELFGHEKGAFSGAISQRIGRFELADGGTLFLDEVADIPLSTQVKLLRVLQEMEFERVGGNETKKVDVRVVAATNRDIKRALEERTFREDLYYRLNVVRIDVPPLRERKDDIPLLVAHFIEKNGGVNKQKIRGVTREAMRILMNYRWPGNIRELENAIEAAIALADNDMIEAKYLPAFLQLNTSLEDGFYFPFGIRLGEMEEEVIKATVARMGGNMTKASRILGISLSTIQRRMKRFAPKDRTAARRS